MRKNLTARQEAMRLAQAMKPRYGRKPKKVKGPSKTYKLRRRIFTRYRLMQGWTPGQIADFLNALHPQWPVSPIAIEKWVRRGMPLADNETRPKKTAKREVPEFRWLGSTLGSNTTKSD
ncbi:MAG TPA: hypothetical protein VGL74_01245 [Terriglobales bacterium]|jgi:hypothetical protein